MEFVLFFACMFAFGLIVGSFLNVVIMRSARCEKLTGRSHCDSCRKTLSWLELIPLFSFAYQKGRCLHCGAVLSVQYPLVELGTALSFCAILAYFFLYNLLSPDIRSFFLLMTTCITVSSMIVVLVSDMRYQIIPNGAVLILAIVGAGNVFLRSGDVVRDIIAGIGFCLFFAALWYFSHGKAMGFGDVKLIFATSLLVGFPASLAAFLFSFWLGGLAGIILILTRRRGLKSKLAFGPFILAGTVLAFFFSDAFFIFSGFSYFF
ncbi:MAG: prepilin peptidase [Candidatus Sungbacteria bacterium]|nr:prepilin peptidase [bacterium]MDZ4285865.1 prepilin peptidase [Candidatus Sungbacteria bacterium]